ncbi:MAG: choice-of-anchor K domain-containing protein [Verrucomicrobiae bacterium]|nr:choice-of-anchor K domain-containing protein [Verrucomicrobiae bacterium]MCP5539508.1 choice-of-anchor K domain-containing protein [Akkermansiaceae bacterium]
MVLLIGVVASIGVLAVNRSNDSTRSAKLTSDVKNLNSAIRIYLANGGSLDGLTTPAEIVQKLKTTQSNSEARQHTGGASSSMVDPRVVPVMQNATEAATSDPRAVYNAATQLFEVATSGAGGVKEFQLDENLNEAPSAVETRDQGSLHYAETSTWVWDFQNRSNPSTHTGPTTVNVSDEPADSTPSSGGGGTEPPTGGGSGGSGGTDPPDPDPDPDPEVDPPAAPYLPFPSFSQSSGGHPFADFPLMLEITNVPDPAYSQAVIKVGSGTWQNYTGSVSVPINTSVQAQFLTLDPDAYQNSAVASAYYYPIATDLTGTVAGTFHDAEGGGTLTSSYGSGGTFFSHGDPTMDLGGEIINAGEPNTLRFEPSNFADIEPGEQFKLGDLFYHNGTTFNDSHATGVQLQIKLNLTQTGAPITFDISMDLVNTENTADAESSADYVRLTNLTQSIPLTINGVSYSIQLSFGGTDSFGFSTGNEFHVYEGATGQGELTAKFFVN